MFARPENKRRKRARKKVTLAEVPTELVLHIAQMLNPTSVVRLSSVSRKFQQDIFTNKSIWETLFIKSFPRQYALITDKSDANFYALLRNAATQKNSAKSKSKRKEYNKLIKAARLGDMTTLRKSNVTLRDLAKCVDSDELSLMDIAKETDQREMLDFLFDIAKEYFFYDGHLDPDKKDSFGYRFLHWVIFCHRSAAEFKQYVAAGCDIQKIHFVVKASEVITSFFTLADATSDTRHTFLHFAAMYGSNDIVIAILDEMNRIAPDNTMINASSQLGFTALWLAVIYGHDEVAKTLLDRGADFHTHCQHMTSSYYPIGTFDLLFHAAIKLGRLNIVKMLIEKGQPIDEVNGVFNAVIVATRFKQSAILALLNEQEKNKQLLTRNPSTTFHHQRNTEGPEVSRSSKIPPAPK